MKIDTDSIASKYPPIDWGKRVPDDLYYYLLENQEISFVVGRFDFPNGKMALQAAYWNGFEFTTRMPKSFQNDRPYYNLCGTTFDQLPVDNYVVIVEDEYECESLNSFMFAHDVKALAITWHGGRAGLVGTNWAPLQGRRVIVWMSNSFEKQECEKWLTAILAEKCADVMVPIFKDEIRKPSLLISSGMNQECFDAINNSKSIKDCFDTVITDENGFTTLEQPIPDTLLYNVRAKLMETGKKYIDPSYSTISQIIEADPAFKRLILYDEATGMMQWNKETYPTIDNLKNGILRRLSSFGCANVPVQTRCDVVDTLMSKKELKVNTILTMVDKLLLSGWCIRSSFDNFCSMFTYGDSSGVEVNKEHIQRAWELFFTKAAYHTLLAWTKRAVPNDIVPVLVGSQGIGKTRLCRYIAMEDRFYNDIGAKQVQFGSADFVRQITGRLIVELGEMAIYRKTEIETVKAVISQTCDEFTPKFKEGTQIFPRMASFIGTSNNQSPLRDTTGNRRFFPINIEKIDWIIFDQPELIQGVWGYFFKKALEGINSDDFHDAYDRDTYQSRDFIDYFDRIRNQSVDMGVQGDQVRRAFQREEYRQYLAISEGKTNGKVGRKREYISIVLTDIADIVYDGRMYAINRDFPKTVEHVARTLGYSSRNDRSGGVVVITYQIHKDDMNLNMRVKKYITDIETENDLRRKDDEKDRKTNTMFPKPSNVNYSEPDF